MDLVDYRGATAPKSSKFHNKYICKMYILAYVCILNINDSRKKLLAGW